MVSGQEKTVNGGQAFLIVVIGGSRKGAKTLRDKDWRTETGGRRQGSGKMEDGI